MPDPTPDPRATLEPVTAEEMEKAADVFDNFNRNSRTVILLRAGAAALRDRDAGWQAADALAGALTAVEAKMPNLDWWDTWQTKTMAFREPEARAISKALAAYTAAKAGRGTA